MNVVYSLALGKALMRRRAAPMGMRVMLSACSMKLSSMGSTLHMPVSSGCQPGMRRPVAFTSRGTLSGVKGKSSAGQGLCVTFSPSNGFFSGRTSA